MLGRPLTKRAAAARKAAPVVVRRNHTVAPQGRTHRRWGCGEPAGGNPLRLGQESGRETQAQRCEERLTMIRREGRLDSAQPDTRTRARNSTRDPIVIRNWERPILVAAVIAILVLGGIGGLNSLVGLFD